MPLTIIAMAEVPAADAGLAAGTSNVSMKVSAAIGLAALGTIATDHSRALLAQGQSLGDALSGGYQLAFAISAVCVAFGLLVSAGRPPPVPQRRGCGHGGRAGRGESVGRPANSDRSISGLVVRDSALGEIRMLLVGG